MCHPGLAWFVCLYKDLDRQVDPVGLRVDFVDLNLVVPPVCPFALSCLPNFHVLKHNKADRELQQIKEKKIEACAFFCVTALD